MPMGRKTVLVVGATGLVGYAALKHFAQASDVDVIAVSRRPPGIAVPHVALDLTDPAACQRAAGAGCASSRSAPAGGCNRRAS